jgi:cytochrome c
MRQTGLVAVLAVGLAIGAAPAARAADDPVKGEAQFAPCGACHSVAAGGPDMTGPNLHGVIGKPAGTNRAKTFAYSPDLKASGLVWDDETLDRWITDPAAVVPHTKMEFVGIGRKDTRSNIIAYLKQATAP